jgi:hypothetical protein
MTSKLFKCVVVALLATCATCMCWCEDSSTKGSLRRADVKRLLNSAKTPEDFEKLASYFDQRAQLFDQKAAEEDAELKRLLELSFRAKNYPIQVGHARISGDYDRTEGIRCSKKAAAFRLRAAVLYD